MPEGAYIGLGSNLGDRKGYIEAALRQLEAVPGISLIACSSAYETTPVGVLEQPDFLNAAASLETELTPEDLLQVLRAIEDEYGRQRHVHWGPRTLDLDLLIYGKRVIQGPELSVPHPYLLERCFVLRPLCEIAPLLKHPQSGRGLSEYERALRCSQLSVAESLKLRAAR